MYKYIITRLLLAIPTLLGAAVLVFLLLRAVPGDICEIRLGGSGLYADPAEVKLCQDKIGLNDPLYVQFGDFITGYLTFDLGESMWTGRPIGYEIGLRFQLSLQVAIMATLVAVLIAIPLGTISAIKQNTWIDYCVRTFSIAGIAIPSFWLGIMIILGLLLTTQAWFGEPWMPPIEYVSPFEDPLGNFAQLIWPAVATGYRYSAVATRMTRSALLEVLREDYVRTARAKGLLEKIIINRHALKNAMLPVVTIITLEFAFLMGGLVVTEQVFNLNGLGRLFVESVLNHDFTLTQQLVMLVVLIFVLTNLFTDVLYAWLDPRIRYS
ncbi:MAG: ABC transporter permease [Rhodospirillaceae bacterium]|nr:ABC transporter permease [Rhodospirillaceae bacterium]MBT4690839.1 ABC transporter permease [Rhodospirillaceae bacterium]MBT5081580.1 ABC transporter permease [Rhodospirillaceae bacterium]MBT5527022.1 ABC transporter permease [Rhodospirillaceae bacterium]MBT5881918.1 ABC transporter permease [Rhodospirillaceae bacterium]